VAEEEQKTGLLGPAIILGVLVLFSFLCVVFCWKPNDTEFACIQRCNEEPNVYSPNGSSHWRCKEGCRAKYRDGYRDRSLD